MVRCHLCGASTAKEITTLTKKPDRENDFGIRAEEYKREIYQCSTCSVYFNWHDFIGKDFYRGTYNSAVYQQKILENYLHIMSLPHEKSDNRHRVARIVDFVSQMKWRNSDVKVLDVGSGLCVFLGALQEFGFDCYSVDPDPSAIEHAVKNVRIKRGYAGTLHQLSCDERFDLITFNKVLEHIAQPIAALSLAKRFLSKRGIVYIELPDGENALKNGNARDREEFYIEHFTVFDHPSLKYLTEKAGFSLLQMASIHEPSDKYTLYGFFRPQDG